MKSTIANVLHLAADKYLAADFIQFMDNHYKNKYSCAAMWDACDELKISDRKQQDITTGLKAMGCPVDTVFAFVNLGYTDRWDADAEEVQAARYMWLKWAALMAEEQGV